MKTVLRGREGREVVIGPEGPFTPIGERLNPTNKPRLQRAYEVGDWKYVQREAIRQAEAGALVIDVNTGDPNQQVEARNMRDALRAVQEVVDLPVAIDSYTVDALVAGLEAAEGRPIVNSVPFEKGYLDDLLPVIAEHKCAMIGMCTRGGAAMPQTAQERIENGRALIAAVNERGIPTEDIVLDPACLPISSNEAHGAGLIEAIRILSTEDGVNTSIGLSNVSFGLPNRRSLNAATLLMAIDAGLGAAIVDMTHKETRHAVLAANLIRGQDEFSAAWIANYRAEEGRAEASKAKRQAE